jgi:hypothetical protein
MRTRSISAGYTLYYTETFLMYFISKIRNQHLHQDKQKTKTKEAVAQLLFELELNFPATVISTNTIIIKAAMPVTITIT